MVWFSGCALYGEKSQYDEGDWYLFAGSAEVASIERDKLVQSEQEWIFKQNKKAYKENRVLNGKKQSNDGKYNFVIAYLPKAKGCSTKMCNVKIYKIMRPPYENRNLWCGSGWYHCKIIRLSLSVLLEPEDRKVQSLPMGYYMTECKISGKKLKYDPLTLMPLHEVDIPEIVLEGTGHTKDQIKNYLVIE